MAHLFPKILTEQHSAFHNSSEKILYDKSNNELSDSFYIFHDITWDNPEIDDSITKGQLDFIIAHPEYGFIVIEVKGGRCSYDAEYKLWETEDKYGIISEIRDPFDQARIVSRVIFKLLHQQNRLKQMFIPHDFVAIFPDTIFDKKCNLRAEVPSWRILDQGDLFDFQSTIENIFKHAFPEKLTNADGMNIIRGIEELFGNKNLKGKTSKNFAIQDSFTKLVQLTENQLSLLKNLRLHKKLLIQGCAGSGKTMFAIHKAKMLAVEGKSVLFVCFNRVLKDFLEEKCKEYSNITVGPFVDLCEEWLEAIKCNINKEDSSEWYDIKIPNLMVDNIDLIPHRFDAIIVDEGQDFKTQYWVVLEFLFNDYENNEFYIFADDNQNIYKGTEEYPIKSEPILLEQNLRNTNQIFKEIKGICSIENAVESSGVDGLPVKYITYEDESEMICKIKNILGELVSEGISLSDVVLLGTKSQKNTSLKYGSKIGPFTLAKDRINKKELRSMTAHAFKGLESPIVILSELDNKVRNLEEIVYIGMSRAISLLYILAEKPIYDILKKNR